MDVSVGVKRELVSPRTLRVVVGLLGMLLPLLVVFGDLVASSPNVLRDSISDYYGTAMRDVLVGILFTVAWFLFAYRGYDDRDSRTGNVACVAMLLVALFPITSEHAIVRAVHVVSAVILFGALAYFSIRLFTKTDEQLPPTPQKLLRNEIYIACGVVMLGCMLAIGIFWLCARDTAAASIKPVLVFESIALWSFGVAWFIKGETCFQDKPGVVATAR